MDDSIPEVFITSSNTACTIYDASNSNECVSYKDGNTFSPKTLAMIGGDYLIGALSNKPMLKVWLLSKTKKQEGCFVVPGMVSALAVSNCGRYCVAGIKDQIFVWEVSTGDLLMILNRHYQPITCLKFTADDSYFISGGKDGHVIVWVLSCVIDVSASPDSVKPQSVWTQHSAEVTDIYCGNSVSRVATTSLDMTCKIYELHSGILLSSICMDAPLTAVVMDLLEYYIFLGDERGYLYKINTYERLPHEIHRADRNNKAALKLHETKIISLGVSFDGSKLMTASEDRSCKLWDMRSMACVLNTPIEGAVTNCFLAIKPLSLTEETVPELFFHPFDKDTSSKKTEKKFIEARIGRKKLSLMYDGCPDKHYAHSIFCSKPGAKVETMSAAAVEDIFRESIHGESLSEMTGCNQQIFALSLHTNLSETFEGPPSPS